MRPFSKRESRGRALLLAREDQCTYLPALLAALAGRGYQNAVFSEPAPLLESLESRAGRTPCLVVVHQPSVCGGEPGWCEAFDRLMRSYAAARAQAPAGQVGLLLVRHRDPGERFRSYYCIDMFYTEPFDPEALSELLDRWHAQAMPRT